MKATPAIGSATRRMRIVRCLRRIPRVDDVHARAAGRVFVGFEMEEDVAPRTHELGQQRLRRGPNHGCRAPAGVAQEQLAAILGERPLRLDLHLARQEERLRVAGAERLHQLVRRQELAVDLVEAQLGVDAGHAAEEIAVQRVELLGQALA
jgi:hypothetical protein